MPVIVRDGEVQIYVYSNEGCLDQLPRVGVRAEGGEAVFVISQDDPPVVLLHQASGLEAAALLVLRERVAGVAGLVRRQWTDGFC